MQGQNAHDGEGSGVAEDKSQSGASRADFLTELAALCCFTANTGSEPKENLTACGVRDRSMNELYKNEAV